jgi:hypothetical protein
LGRHERRAALPPGDFTRPATVDEASLVVTFCSEDGSEAKSFDFTRLPAGLALRQAFAAALDRKAGPGGTWRSAETCQKGFQTAAAFLRWLDARGNPPQSAAEITPATWSQWCLSLPDSPGAHGSRHRMRVLLREVDGLPAGTLKAVRRSDRTRPASAEAAYSYQELARIRSQASAVFNTALARIRASREHLRRWHAGEFTDGSTGWLIGEALDCLARTGDMPKLNGTRRGIPARYVHALGGNSPESTWGRLYLTRGEAAAVAVLLVASEGWNRSVLDRMRIPEHHPAAGDDISIHTVEISKRRRPVRLSYTTNNLVDAGPGTPGRLMSQVIEVTEMARHTLRQLGEPSGRLLVWRRANGVAGRFGFGSPENQGAASRRPGDLTKVSLRRLRRTVQVLIRKEPAQNSQDTHDSVYVLRDPATRAEARETIAQGLEDAVAHAGTVVKMRVVLGHDGTRLTELSDDPELAAAIDRGDHDTATGACASLTGSPFSEPGLPCTASFLLCLACPNAIATRRHLPRLGYLREALEELRAVVDPAAWDQDWRTHLIRVSTLLDTHTTTAERAAAREHVSDRDRDLIDRMLNRRLDA